MVGIAFWYTNRDKWTGGLHPDADHFPGGGSGHIVSGNSAGLGKDRKSGGIITDGNLATCSWKYFTRWTKDVSPENVWPEYPRPQMRRQDWLNLNGLWKYGIFSKERDYGVSFDNEILVPYPIELALSGVKRGLQPDERLWYQRMFTIPDSWQGRHVPLHFGAVDWEASIWVNGNEVGLHRGGYLPFWFDITPHLLDGDNELVVAVWDPTDASWQQHGKQVHKPKSIWYTAVSGIWQTVWLEPVAETAITRLKITPNIDSGTIRVKVDVRHASTIQTDRAGMRITVYETGVPIAQVEMDRMDGEIEIPIPNPKMWSPETPHLYDLSVEAGEDRRGKLFWDAQVQH